MSHQPAINIHGEPEFACSESWRNWWQDSLLRSKVLDAFERVAILALFIHFLRALTGSMVISLNAGQSVVIGDLMLLITESMMVVLVVCRRGAKDLSLRTSDWALAFSATCLSLLARPYPTGSHWWDVLAIVLTMTGLSTQLFSKLTLGRRFGLVAANRGICSTGPYRIVRHPIYFGYVMLHVGFFLLNPTIWNFVVFSTLYTIKIPRILAEERLLSRDADYRDYMTRVKWRLIPGVF